MKKKIMAMCLVIAMAATAVIGGTLAYFTDTDSATNVMTLGKVDIKQLEEQRYFDENGNVWTMGDFEQNKPLMPMVDTREDKTANPVVNGFFDSEMNNVVDKIVSVTNVAEEGAKNSDAYVRTLIAFETAKEYVEGTDEVRRGAEEIFYTYIGQLGVKDAQFIKGATIMVDNVEYVVAEVVYEDALKPGETTKPSLKQFFLSPDANNEVSLLFGEEYTILALSQAVQTAGFDNAKVALDTAFGEVSVENIAVVQSWFEEIAQ